MHLMVIHDPQHLMKHTNVPRRPYYNHNHLGFADFAVEAGIVPLSTFVLNFLCSAHKRLF